MLWNPCDYDATEDERAYDEYLAENQEAYLLGEGEELDEWDLYARCGDLEEAWVRSQTT